MERPKDVDFVCLLHVDGSTWRGVPLNRCHVLDATDPNNATGPDPLDDRDPAVHRSRPCTATITTSCNDRNEYRLHAVVTQLARGELVEIVGVNVVGHLGDHLLAGAIAPVRPRTPSQRIPGISGACAGESACRA